MCCTGKRLQEIETVVMELHFLLQLFLRKKSVLFFSVSSDACLLFSWKAYDLSVNYKPHLVHSVIYFDFSKTFSLTF